MRAEGDDDFEVAFVRLYPRAVAVARRILHDRSAAEDVAAEALARTYVRWRSVKGLPWLDAWVLRVVINLALSIARRPSLQLSEQPPDLDDDDAVTRIALVVALRTLPRRQREAIALRFLGGLSEAESACALGCAPGTVKSHVHRGLGKLRTLLQDDTEAIEIALET